MAGSKFRLGDVEVGFKVVSDELTKLIANVRKEVTKLQEDLKNIKIDLGIKGNESIAKTMQKSTETILKAKKAMSEYDKAMVQANKAGAAAFREAAEAGKKEVAVIESLRAKVEALKKSKNDLGKKGWHKLHEQERKTIEQLGTAIDVLSGNMILRQKQMTVSVEKGEIARAKATAKGIDTINNFNEKADKKWKQSKGQELRDHIDMAERRLKEDIKAGKNLVQARKDHYNTLKALDERYKSDISKSDARFLRRTTGRASDSLHGQQGASRTAQAMYDSRAANAARNAASARTQAETKALKAGLPAEVAKAFGLKREADSLAKSLQRMESVASRQKETVPELRKAIESTRSIVERNSKDRAVLGTKINNDLAVARQQAAQAESKANSALNRQAEAVGKARRAEAAHTREVNFQSGRTVRTAMGTSDVIQSTRTPEERLAAQRGHDSAVWRFNQSLKASNEARKIREELAAKQEKFDKELNENARQVGVARRVEVTRAGEVNFQEWRMRRQVERNGSLESQYLRNADPNLIASRDAADRAGRNRTHSQAVDRFDGAIHAQKELTQAREQLEIARQNLMRVQSHGQEEINKQEKLYNKAVVDEQLASRRAALHHEREQYRKELTAQETVLKVQEENSKKKKRQSDQELAAFDKQIADHKKAQEAYKKNTNELLQVEKDVAARRIEAGEKVSKVYQDQLRNVRAIKAEVQTSGNLDAIRSVKNDERGVMSAVGRALKAEMAQTVKDASTQLKDLHARAAYAGAEAKRYAQQAGATETEANMVGMHASKMTYTRGARRLEAGGADEVAAAREVHTKIMELDNKLHEAKQKRIKQTQDATDKSYKEQAQGARQAMQQQIQDGEHLVSASRRYYERMVEIARNAYGHVSREAQHALDNQVHSAYKAMQSAERVNTMDAFYNAMLMGGGGIGFLAAMKSASDSASLFEKNLRNVASIAHVTNEQLHEMGETVTRMSSSDVIAKAPAELAEALYDIYSSGFKGSTALEVLEVAAKGASAGLSDTKSASYALVGAMNAFDQKEGPDAVRLMDIMFKTVDKGVITFNEMSQGMGMVVGSAAQFGVSMEEIGAAMSMLTIKGIPATEAFTSLNNLILHIAKPSEEASKYALSLGMNWFNAATAATHLKEVGLSGVISEITAATKGSQESLVRLLPEIRAFRGASALFADSGRDFVDMLDTMQKASGATDMALEQQARSFAFHTQQLSVAWDRLKDGFGESINFKSAIDTLRQFVDLIAGLPGPMKTLIMIAGGLGMAFMTWLGAVFTVNFALGQLSQSVAATGVISTATARATQGLGLALRVLTGPIGATTAAIALIVGGIMMWNNASEERRKQAAVDVASMIEQQGATEELTQKMDGYRRIIEDSQVPLEEREKAERDLIETKKRLIEIAPELDSILKNETSLNEEARAKLKEYNDEFERKLRLKAEEATGGMTPETLYEERRQLNADNAALQQQLESIQSSNNTAGASTVQRRIDQNNERLDELKKFERNLAISRGIATSQTPDYGDSYGDSTTGRARYLKDHPTDVITPVNGIMVSHALELAKAKTVGQPSRNMPDEKSTAAHALANFLKTYKDLGVDITGDIDKGFNVPLKDSRNRMLFTGVDNPDANNEYLKALNDLKSLREAALSERRRNQKAAESASRSSGSGEGEADRREQESQIYLPFRRRANITSTFNDPRDGRKHGGLDFAGVNGDAQGLRAGDTITSPVMKGTVTSVYGSGVNSGIEIKLPNGKTLQMNHVIFEKAIKEGTKIVAGMTLGKLADWGKNTHLDMKLKNEKGELIPLESGMPQLRSQGVWKQKPVVGSGGPRMEAREADEQTRDMLTAINDDLANLDEQIQDSPLRASEALRNALVFLNQMQVGLGAWNDEAEISTTITRKRVQLEKAMGKSLSREMIDDLGAENNGNVVGTFFSLIQKLKDVKGLKAKGYDTNELLKEYGKLHPQVLKAQEKLDKDLTSRTYESLIKSQSDPYKDVELNKEKSLQAAIAQLKEDYMNAGTNEGLQKRAIEAFRAEEHRIVKESHEALVGFGRTIPDAIESIGIDMAKQKVNWKTVILDSFNDLVNAFGATVSTLADGNKTGSEKAGGLAQIAGGLASNYFQRAILPKMQESFGSVLAPAVGPAGSLVDGAGAALSTLGTEISSLGAAVAPVLPVIMGLAVLMGGLMGIAEAYSLPPELAGKAGEIGSARRSASNYARVGMGNSQPALQAKRQELEGILGSFSAPGVREKLESDVAFGDVMQAIPFVNMVHQMFWGEEHVQKKETLRKSKDIPGLIRELSSISNKELQQESSVISGSLGTSKADQLSSLASKQMEKANAYTIDAEGNVVWLNSDAVRKDLAGKSAGNTLLSQKLANSATFGRSALLRGAGLMGADQFGQSSVDFKRGRADLLGQALTMLENGGEITDETGGLFGSKGKTYGKDDIRTFQEAFAQATKDAFDEENKVWAEGIEGRRAVLQAGYSTILSDVTMNSQRRTQIEQAQRIDSMNLDLEVFNDETRTNADRVAAYQSMWDGISQYRETALAQWRQDIEDTAAVEAGASQRGLLSLDRNERISKLGDRSLDGQVSTNKSGLDTRLGYIKSELLAEGRKIKQLLNDTRLSNGEKADLETQLHGLKLQYMDVEDEKRREYQDRYLADMENEFDMREKHIEYLFQTGQILQTDRDGQIQKSRMERGAYLQKVLDLDTSAPDGEKMSIEKRIEMESSLATVISEWIKFSQEESLIAEPEHVLRKRFLDQVRTIPVDLANYQQIVATTMGNAEVAWSNAVTNSSNTFATTIQGLATILGAFTNGINSNIASLTAAINKIQTSTSTSASGTVSWGAGGTGTYTNSTGGTSTVGTSGAYYTINGAIYAPGSSAHGQAAYMGGVIGYADGGTVPGGFRLGDRVKALLTPGEVVLSHGHLNSLGSMFQSMFQFLSVAPSMGMGGSNIRIDISNNSFRNREDIDYLINRIKREITNEITLQVRS